VYVLKLIIYSIKIKNCKIHNKGRINFYIIILGNSRSCFFAINV